MAAARPRPSRGFAANPPTEMPPKRTVITYLIEPGFTGPQTPVPIRNRHNWVNFTQNVFHLQEVPAVPS